MNPLIKKFCKEYNLKFEDYNENSGILVASKICKQYAFKDNYSFLKGKKELVGKYRFFTYFKVVNYGNYIDCVTIYNEKRPINNVGTILTANMINFLKSL